MKHAVLAASASVLLWLSLPALAVAHDHDRAQTSGLSLGVGAGHDSSGVGIHALYYVQLSERWRIAPHVGVGWIGDVGGAGGVLTAFGHRHRLVVDASVGPIAASGGTGIKTELFYGVGLAFGWEWMTQYGLALRSSVGPALRRPPSGESWWGVTINLLSIDYKLW